MFSPKHHLITSSPKSVHLGLSFFPIYRVGTWGIQRRGNLREAIQVANGQSRQPFFGCVQGMQKFQGQGLHQWDSSNPSHGSDDARSLTCWTTRQLKHPPFFKRCFSIFPSKPFMPSGEACKNRPGKGYVNFDVPKSPSGTQNHEIDWAFL